VAGSERGWIRGPKFSGGGGMGGSSSSILQNPGG
jgi:hypothetical protein